MSKNVLTLEAFADWCKQQPPEKEYEWNDPNVCACGQYAQYLGVHEWHLGLRVGGFWCTANDIAFMTAPRTFGELAKRLRFICRNV